MEWLLHLLVGHAYTVLFAWVLMEQGGLPVPSAPLMVAVGTMSAAHKMHVAYALPLVLLACLIADTSWFFLGKRFGGRVLNMLCKFSLEAATCVEKTQGTVVRRGPITLLFSKWVPGLNTVAAPIAGQAGIPFVEFIIYDMAGTLAWAAAWLFAGRFFGDVAKRSHEFFTTLGHLGVLLVVMAALGVVVYRFVKRRQFVSELRGLRLEPFQLMAMIGDAEREGLEPPFIVDLRHPLDVLTEPLVISGALRIGPDELRQRHELIPRDRDIILYCTCPSEETSAKVAMDLRRMGVRRVRPLRGGLQGWREAGFPVDGVEAI